MSKAAVVYLSKWSAKSDTYRTMKGALDVLARTVMPGRDHETYPWGELRRDAVRQIPAKLREAGFAVNTVNKCLCALRGVLEEASQTGELPMEEYQRIGKIKGLKGSVKAAGRALEEEDAVAFEEGIEAGLSVRDAALLTMLYVCGLRRVEIVRLRREDYDPRTGEVLARGKGDKERLVPVTKEWRPVIEAHWRAVPPRNYLFFSERRKTLSRNGVSQIVERFCRVAGVRRFTPHDLRRTFATKVIEESDPLIAKELLGHVSLETTSRYDRRDKTAHREAVDRAFKRKK